MPAVARSGGSDKVLSPDGRAKKCRAPMKTATGSPGQSKVYAQGVLVVIQGDPVAVHPKSGCSPDTSSLSSASGKVFAGGGGIGRIGDRYGNNTITSGCSKVFAG